MSRTVKKGMMKHGEKSALSRDEFNEIKETEKIPFWLRRAGERIRSFDTYEKYFTWHMSRYTNGHIGGEISEPCRDCPKGYDTWNEVWGSAGRKKGAKTETARLNRRKADDEIRKILFELE